MTKLKLYMKYFVLKMEDYLDLDKLWDILQHRHLEIEEITIRDFAEDLLSCIKETTKE